MTPIEMAANTEALLSFLERGLATRSIHLIAADEATTERLISLLDSTKESVDAFLGNNYDGPLAQPPLG